MLPITRWHEPDYSTRSEFVHADNLRRLRDAAACRVREKASLAQAKKLPRKAALAAMRDAATHRQSRINMLLHAAEK